MYRMLVLIPQEIFLEFGMYRHRELFYFKGKTIGRKYAAKNNRARHMSVSRGAVFEVFSDLDNLMLPASRSLRSIAPTFYYLSQLNIFQSATWKKLGTDPKRGNKDNIFFYDSLVSAKKIWSNLSMPLFIMCHYAQDDSKEADLLAFGSRSGQVAGGYFYDYTVKLEDQYGYFDKTHLDTISDEDKFKYCADPFVFRLKESQRDSYSLSEMLHFIFIGQAPWKKAHSQEHFSPQIRKNLLLQLEAYTKKFMEDRPEEQQETTGNDPNEMPLFLLSNISWFRKLALFLNSRDKDIGLQNKEAIPSSGKRRSSLSPKGKAVKQVKRVKEKDFYPTEKDRFSAGMFYDDKKEDLMSVELDAKVQTKVLRHNSQSRLEQGVRLASLMDLNRTFESQKRRPQQQDQMNCITDSIAKKSNFLMDQFSKDFLFPVTQMVSNFYFRDVLKSKDKDSELSKTLQDSLQTQQDTNWAAIAKMCTPIIKGMLVNARDDVRYDERDINTLTRALRTTANNFHKSKKVAESPNDDSGSSGTDKKQSPTQEIIAGKSKRKSSVESDSSTSKKNCKKEKDWRKVVYHVFEVIFVSNP